MFDLYDLYDLLFYLLITWSHIIVTRIVDVHSSIHSHPSIPFACFYVSLLYFSHFQQATADVLTANGADLSHWQQIAIYLVDVYGDVIADSSSTGQIFATNDAFRGLTAPVTKQDDGTVVPNFNQRYLTEVCLGVWVCLCCMCSGAACFCSVCSVCSVLFCFVLFCFWFVNFNVSCSLYCYCYFF